MFLATVLVIIVLLVQDPYSEKYEVFMRLVLNFSWDSELAKLLKSTDANDLGRYAQTNRDIKEWGSGMVFGRYLKSLQAEMFYAY